MITQIRTLARLCLYALPVWGMLRGLWLLLRRPRRRILPLREAAMGVFAAFMAGIMCMVLQGKWQSPAAMLQSALQRLPTLDKIHLRPFHTIGPQIARLPSTDSLSQLLGNILLFSPWGFFLPLLWPHFRTPLRIIGMSLVLTCTIEFTQLFIDRYVEVDDILLNFLGSMLGTGAWLFLHRCFPRMDALLLDDA